MELACDAALKNRHYDAEGRLHILRTPISKAAVNPYYGKEIPNAENLGLQPERVYYMLRDPGELAKAASSFARNQLMFKHTAVNADDPKQESIAGTIGSEVEFQAPYLIADLCIWDAEAIAGVETDTVRELSASYRYRADMTPGVYEGQRYDGVMRDIQGNHVALVKAGRAGSDVMAADSELETTMSKAEEMANKVAADKDDNAARYAAIAAKGGDKKAKDRKRAKDWTFEDWESDRSEQELEKDDPQGQDRRKARDAEEDDEDKAKRKEFEKKAEDAEKMCKDSFKELVEKLQAKGYSKEYATKIAGKVANEKGDDKAMDRKAKDTEERDEVDPEAKDKKAKDRKAKDRISKDAQTAEERAMWAQMRKDGSADDPEDDAMPASLRHASDSRMKHAMDEFKAELRAAEEARRAVRSVVGDVLAYDTAEEIYSFALDQMKIDHKGVDGVPALRALFNVAQEAKKPTPRVAYDSTGIEEKFPSATRHINVM